MLSLQKNSKKINALLMCHLPLLFGLIVLKFPLTNGNADRVQLNFLTLIEFIGLSPLFLLLLTKFPLESRSPSRLESLTPAFVIFAALGLQIKELTSLLAHGELPEFGFGAKFSLAPILIVTESLTSLRPALDDKFKKNSRIEKSIVLFVTLILALNIFEIYFPSSMSISTFSVIFSITLILTGVTLFFLSRYRSPNSKMLSILLYYCLQAAILSFMIPVFDSQINNSILYLGIILALTIDSVFLRPEALVENGFSLSPANRLLRDTYEKKISDSASLANATLDSLTARICILNKEGAITAVNRAWRVFALEAGSQDPDAFVGQNYLHICRHDQSENSDCAKQIEDGIRRVLSGDLSEYTKIYPCHSPTERQWFLCRVTRFETSSGHCAVVAHEDITDLKLAEEDLLLKNTAIEKANDGIVLTDPNLPDHPLVYVSPGFLNLTGYSKEEVLGRNCRFLQGPDTDPESIRKIRDAIAHCRPFVGDIINYNKHGRTWINRLRLEPIFDQQGRLLRYLGVQSDVTEQRRLEEERNRALEQEKVARLETEKHFQEAQAANTLKDEFLATLSHELRTPAGVIGGFIELLKYETLDPVEREEALDAIERNSRALVTLIDDILDVSRVVTGKFKLNPKPVDLEAVVDSVISAELLAAQAKNIRIVTEFEPGIGPVYGDVTRLQQIFWNLLSNAIKFTPRNGRVKVTLRTDGPRALIKVSDTGVGIDAKFLPHVFERFRQQNSGMNRTYGGLGLGLSIVKHLVELHGGLVWAESEGQGRGSTFTVSLPILTSSG